MVFVPIGGKAETGPEIGIETGVGAAGTGTEGVVVTAGVVAAGVVVVRGVKGVIFVNSE